MQTSVFKHRFTALALLFLILILQVVIFLRYWNTHPGDLLALLLFVTTIVCLSALVGILLSRHVPEKE